MLGPPGPEYELDRAGATLYLFPFGGYTYPIQDTSVEHPMLVIRRGGHTDLSPIVCNYSPSWAQEFREDSEDGDLNQHKRPPSPPS